MQKHKTLGNRGQKHTKTLEMVSGSEGFSVVVVAEGGESPQFRFFVIFQNPKRNYPIRGVPDDVPSVSYCIAPKGFMDKITMGKFLLSSAWGDGLQRNLYLDNYSSHLKQDKLARMLSTAIKPLPPNASHVVQACDRPHANGRIKKDYRRLCADERRRQRETDEYKKTGKIPNTGKHGILQMIGKVAEMSSRPTKDDMHPAKKALIETGLDVPESGVWSVDMLHSELRQIVQENKEYFDGTIPESSLESRDEQSDDDSKTDEEIDMTETGSQSSTKSTQDKDKTSSSGTPKVCNACQL